MQSSAQSDGMRSPLLDRSLGEFVERLKGIDDLEGLRGCFQNTVEELGFRYFAYHIVRASGLGTHLRCAVTTYPTDWVQHYIARDYIHVDPVIGTAPGRLLPFAWDELPPPRSEDRATWRMMSEAFDIGVRNGLTIPIHGRRGEFALMSVIPQGGEQEAHGILRQHKHLLHLLTLYYHNHTGSILLEDYINSTPAGSVLTRRERECLGWVARGKSTWDISKILGVSESTALFHIENAKRKLGVHSRPHAVVRAIMSGLIDAD